MLSIIEQLARSQPPAANLKPSRKPHGPNVAKHSMSATQIEAEILNESCGFWLEKEES